MPSAAGAVRQPALALEHVTCTFASREHPGDRYTAVRDTTLMVGQGEFVSVVGPTGCGKSTLLNVAAGLLKPSSGAVRIFGEALSGINRKAGYMFQSDAVLWTAFIHVFWSSIASTHPFLSSFLYASRRSCDLRRSARVWRRSRDDAPRTSRASAA